MRTLDCDVLVIGSGAAGAFGALAAADLGADVCLVAKSSLLYGNTRLAGGIVACPSSFGADSAQRFVEDVLKAGGRINRRELVELVAHEGLKALQLLEEWGYVFKRDTQGDPTLVMAGGHQVPRSLLCSYRGSSLSTLLRMKIVHHEKITPLEGQVLYRLFQQEGRVTGALFLDFYSGEPVLINAASVLLATGGAGMLYAPHTDNTREAAGEGLAFALKAGAELVDMEFMQWLPFAVTYPRDLVGIECGEPFSAGPHGVLADRKGEVFLSRINKLTRAQVNRAIFTEIKKGNATENGGVTLDPRANLKDPDAETTYLQLRDGGYFNAVRQAYGEEAYKWHVPYEVAPTAHYTLGGIKVDSRGYAGIAGLFAAGEVTGGFHGADRLGSVALTECFVFGSKAGYFAWENSQRIKGAFYDREKTVEDLQALFGREGQETPAKLMEELGETMWELAGGVRDRAGLQQALTAIGQIRLKSKQLKTPAFKKWNQPVKAAIELDAMLVVAEAVVRSALAREESRGNHFRLDYPEVSPVWEGKNIFIRLDGERKLAVSVKDGGTL